MSGLATRIETRTEAFARESRAERAELADPAVPLDPQAGRERVPPSGTARFDPLTYEHGLRPERWRIAVLGAFKRGKSSLINAIAGGRVLADEGADVEMRFPVHVRYGAQHRAYALGDDAGWNAIALDEALDAATRTPVLIETPWTLPRELVLVHTPAFDSGFPLANEIVRAAADAASEIVALFSRQLSDRELELYAAVAEGGKPMTFVHTMADHEDSAERRNVVMLADRYLRERAIVPQRIFTTSTLEYREALDAGRAPAGWNELLALRATLEAHAEEHMARLVRGERERIERDRLARSAPKSEPPEASERGSFMRRLFGRRFKGASKGVSNPPFPNRAGRVRHLHPRPSAYRAGRRHAGPRSDRHRPGPNRTHPSRGRSQRPAAAGRSDRRTRDDRRSQQRRRRVSVQPRSRHRGRSRVARIRAARRERLPRRHHDGAVGIDDARGGRGVGSGEPAGRSRRSDRRALPGRALRRTVPQPEVPSRASRRMDPAGDRWSARTR